jgi:hypothetical protein
MRALQWLLFLSFSGVLIYACVVNLRPRRERWDDK